MRLQRSPGSDGRPMGRSTSASTALFLALMLAAQPDRLCAFEGPIAASKCRLESVEERERLPLHKIIPAATRAELTLALPTANSKAIWSRSHGDAGNTRYSPLAQITRENVVLSLGRRSRRTISLISARKPTRSCNGKPAERVMGGFCPSRRIRPLFYTASTGAPSGRVPRSIRNQVGFM